jgi:DNA-binding transcriptional ArsR family regulator
MFIYYEKRRLGMNSKDSCTVFSINSKKIEEVKASLKSETIFQLLAEAFKVLGDPARIKILYSLSISELCVCEISLITGLSQSAVSHQLRILRNTKLVKYRREGRSVFYSLDDRHVEKLFEQGLEHIEEG